MPARAFVDSDRNWFWELYRRGGESKCPQGHLLILMFAGRNLQKLKVRRRLNARKGIC